MALAIVGCSDDEWEVDPDVDCTEECHPECDLEQGFDFEGYEPTCELDEEGDEAEGSPRLCRLHQSEEEGCQEVDFELEEATIETVHDALREGRISCEWLTQAYIDRALWHDLYMGDGKAAFNAFIYLNEEAMETARRLDDYQRCEGELTGPMHCIPMGIKANFASKEVPITNGSFALGEAQATRDAFLVERLRQAGALVLGSTTMDEFAAGAVGLSGRSGKTGNAYDRDGNSGGSSAGSGVATSANLMMAGLGTDNCSSLVIPASYNGLVSLRSSHQLLSTDGIFPSNRLDAVAGAMTRTVEDQARFMDEMSVFNPHYGPHCSQEMEHDVDYQGALNEDGLEGARIGVVQSIDQGDDEQEPFGDSDQEHLDIYERFFDELESQGAEVVHDLEIPDLSLNRGGSGSGWDGDQFLKDTEGGPESFQAICDSGLYSHSTYEDYDACMQRATQTKEALEDNLNSWLPYYASNRQYVMDLMDEWEVDALVYPTDRRGWAASQYTWSTCQMASVTGLPTAVIPIGMNSHGMSVGMSWTGRMFDDARLLELLYSYEQAHSYREAPEMESFDEAPPVNIEAFNELNYDVGMAAFDEVMGEEDKFNMTAARFYEIAFDVLDEAGYLEYLMMPQ